MIRQIKYELHVMGVNFWILSSVFSLALIMLSAITGELLDFYPVCFEVLFPFFTALAAGEWGKTRADANFDLIAAQSSSLFRWVSLRYITVFGSSVFFAVLCMAGACFLRYELPLSELLVIYFPTSFFLSSLSALSGILCRREHASALISGTVWLAMLSVRSLLTFPGVEYMYLFIRYAKDPNQIWLCNKLILTLLGLLIWKLIYLKCKTTRTSLPRTP